MSRLIVADVDPRQRACANCGSEFRVRYPSARKVCCSRSCASKLHPVSRGPANPNWRGGKRSHPLYHIYQDMLGRCRRATHHAYSDYGARGITVCERWQADFWAFVADMGERAAGQSLDRRNNDGPYSPENCRWATALEQRHNRRPQRLKPKCKHGHKYTPETTAYTRTGKRRCLICERRYAKDARNAKKAAA